MKNSFLSFLKKYYPVIIIFVCSVFVCIPLLNSNLNMFYDDGVQHICRLIGTEQSIKEGGLFFPIMSKFANEFGYSWNIFYSPLTSYLPLIFRLFSFTFVNSIKIFMFLVTFISGITMYLCAKKLTKNNKIALIASILYIFMPYRFTDMYIRNALAELTSFIFIPLVFLGINNILEEKKKIDIWFLIGTVGLILTHLIVTLYCAIFACIYLIINYKKIFNVKIIKYLCINIILVLLLSAFFICPLLEHKINTNYEVFKEGRMERTDVLIYYKLDFSQLFVSIDKDKMIYDIGFVSTIFLCLTPIVIYKYLKYKKENDNKNENNDNKQLKDYFKVYITFLIFGIICLIMTLKLFPFEKLPSILKMIQFTFRLLEFSGFFLSIVVAINIYNIISKKYIKYAIVFLVILLMLLSMFYIPCLKISENSYDETKLMPAVRVTQETKRVHAGLASFEYLPSKVFENRSYLEQRENKVIVLSGNVNITNENKNDSKLEFEVSNINDETILELPYIYYLGYNVKLIQNDKISIIDTSESDNGFVQIKLNKDQNGLISVSYTGSNIMIISRIVSITTLIILCIFFAFKKLKINNKK